MVAWWAMDIRGGALTRPDRTRIEIGLHLVAELLTAALLVVGGVIVLTGGPAIVALIALGMLLYTVIQSPGYFVARGEAGPVAMFAVLALTTVLAMVGAATLD